MQPHRLLRGLPKSTPYPDMSDRELEVVKRWIRPAIDALITEALARSGATREELRRERRGGREPKIRFG